MKILDKEGINVIRKRIFFEGGDQFFSSIWNALMGDPALI